MNDIRDLARGMASEALAAGGMLALDSAIRVLGNLVEEFTVKGHVREAAGASAGMELIKRLRDDPHSLFGDEERK
jgi:hypothetical protein